MFLKAGAIQRTKEQDARGRRASVGRLVYSINITLDGSCDHTQSIADDEHHEYALQLLKGAAALLLGRNTFELFEGHWPHVARSDSGPPSVRAFARELDSKTKYVVSRQRTASEWAGTVFLSGDLTQEISSLKRRESGDLVLFGSPGLARTLAELNEIDEYHFLIQPVFAGRGPRMFDGIAQKLELVHRGSQVFRSGVHLTRWVPAES